MCSAEPGQGRLVLYGADSGRVASGLGSRHKDRWEKTGGRSGLMISDFVENEAVIAGDFGRKRAKIPLTFPPPSVDWCRLVERFDVPTVHYSQQNQHVFQLTTALTAQASCTKQTHVDAVFVTQNRDRRVLRPPILLSPNPHSLYLSQLLTDEARRSLEEV